MCRADFWSRFKRLLIKAEIQIQALYGNVEKVEARIVFGLLTNGGALEFWLTVWKFNCPDDDQTKALLAKPVGAGFAMFAEIQMKMVSMMPVCVGAQNRSEVLASASIHFPKKTTFCPLSIPTAGNIDCLAVGQRENTDVDCIAVTMFR